MVQVIKQQYSKSDNDEGGKHPKWREGGQSKVTQGVGVG